MSYNLSSISDYSCFNYKIPEMVSTETTDYNVLSDLPSYDLQALLNNKGDEQNPNQLENLCLYRTTQFRSLSSSRNPDKGYENFDFAYNDENVAKFLQRSCFNGHSFRNFQGPDNSFFENSLMKKPGFKIGRYNPEERQERISKYRAKRNQRNFNKRIKYACRKTIADNRPRIRGRFARNDETVEIQKAPCSTRHEEEFELWALHEVEDETMAIGTFMNSFSLHQFQYSCHGRF
ncbi:two-component response regulator-like APRR3 isoform X1 [Gossypium raimondii]|nr:two-component response regulator-like APRR3 isoform X1 [Gossypium raimondii]